MAEADQDDVYKPTARLPLATFCHWTWRHAISTQLYARLVSMQSPFTTYSGHQARTMSVMVSSVPGAQLYGALVATPVAAIAVT